MNDKLSITIDEEKRELFMSFGLLNELTTLVGDPARVPAVPVDADLREQVLASCLAERKKNGKLISKPDLEEIDISIEDAEKVIDWAVEHVMGFFVRSLNKVVKVTQANQDDLKALASFLVGSNVLASETA